jgi:hypothetical protein
MQYIVFTPGDRFYQQPTSNKMHVFLYQELAVIRVAI